MFPDVDTTLIERSDRPVPEGTMRRLLRKLLDESTLCAIATVQPSGTAHVHTAYFAWTPDFALTWLSAPGATHSRNLRKSPSAAVAVFDSTQTWEGSDRGVQLFGTAREAGPSDAGAAERAYRRRFPHTWASDEVPYRFYVFRPRSVKLFDEAVLGSGAFVTARVGRGGRLSWRRTEIYD